MRGKNMKITKRIKTIAVCATLACGAIAGAAIGILVYQTVKAVEEKIKKTINNPDLMGYIAYRAQQLENTHSFQAQNLAVDYAIKLASGGSKTCLLHFLT